MRSFIHFIVTIYNIGNTNQQWLNDRLELFQKYTVPSILNQTDQNFIWIVVLDGNTPSKYITQLYQTVNYKPNIIFILVPPTTLPRSKSINKTFAIARKHILQLVPSQIDLLVTTGLDNDDAISTNYIQKVHEEIQKRKDESGYLLDVTLEIVVDIRHQEYTIRNVSTSVLPSVTCTAVEEVSITNRTAIHSHAKLWRPKKRESILFDVRYCIEANNLHICHHTNARHDKHQDWTLSTRSWVQNILPVAHWKTNHGTGFEWLDDF